MKRKLKKTKPKISRCKNRKKLKKSTKNLALRNKSNSARLRTKPTTRAIYNRLSKLRQKLKRERRTSTKTN